MTSRMLLAIAVLLTLGRGCAAAFAAGGDLLRVRAALRRAAARGRRVRLLAAAARGARRVCDPRRPLLRHPLLLQLLVLLLVLDARSLVGHATPFPLSAFPAASVPNGRG